jgi:enamine deaminase RidA (YjgF/YER057c/UK114 family)
MPCLLLLLLTAFAAMSVTAFAQDRQMEMIGPVAASAYSAAVKVKGGTMVFLASMEPVDEEGNVVAPGDFAGQTVQIWKNMATALKLAGGSLDDVVTMTVFTTERRWGEQFTEMRKSVFKKGFPSSAFMEAAKLKTPGAFVAIRAIAVVPQ